MNRMSCFLITALLLLLFSVYPAASYGKDSSRIAWQVNSLGKPSCGLILGSNGLFYYLSGSKLLTLDSNGKKVLEITVPGNSKNVQPVLGPSGSIFIPGDSSVCEIKANGSTGWKFSVLQEKQKSPPLLTAGPLDLLYIPLSSGMYAIDTNGRFKWNMPWDKREANRPRMDTKREILDCAANDKFAFAVEGEQNKGFSLVAVNSGGETDWRYWLGDIKSAKLSTGPDGSLYVTAVPGKIDSHNKAKVYAFDRDSGGTPRWSYSVALGELTSPTCSRHDMLYIGALEHIIALKSAGGEVLWKTKLLEAKSQPAIDENSKTAYLGTEDDRFLALSPGGRLAWEIELDGKLIGQPVVISGIGIYVITDKGTLYKIKDSATTSQGG